MVTKSQKLVSSVVDEVTNLTLQEHPEAWNDLDVLSSNTHVDAIEVDPVGVTLRGDKFSGIANVYVVLEYGGGQEPEGFTTSDGFLGKFSGHFDEHKKPVVDEFLVDTSPFYAGENID